MQNRVIGSLALISALSLPSSSVLNTGLKAQQVLRDTENTIIKSTPQAASAPTSVPALILYSGTAAGADGKPIVGEVPITFMIYKDETGGEPLFTETQAAYFDAAGRYQVKLGATLSSGIPIGLFGTGEARWLEVQVAGANVTPRVLLTSVPYALKAGDASTLGGLPASAYALAGSGNAQSTTSIAAAGVSPDTGTNVTTTGGTSGYLPVFNGGATVVDSIIFQTSTGVGIGDSPNSLYQLDVNGKSILRGATNLANNGNATSSAGTDSFPLTFNASVYNSSTKADAAPIYYWQAEPQNNNTASPGATLNLLYNSNYGTGAETGLFLNANGTVHFGAGQTFNASGGGGTAFNGTSSSGSGVAGTSASGSGVLGNSTSSNGVYGTSSTGDGLLGLTAGTTLKTAGVLGVAGTGNTSGFTGIAGVWGDANAHVGVLGSSTQYSGVQGVSASSYGVQGSSNTSYGVIGTTYASSGAAAGVYGYSSTSTPGVKGASTTSDGGDFYGGGSGNGVVGVGGSNVSSNGPGEGGHFLGGNGDESNPVSGAVGVYGQGGTGGSSSGGTGGNAFVGFGGTSESGNGGVGGIFDGGDSDSGNGGIGLTAFPGFSSSNGSAYAAQFYGSIDINGTVHSDVASLQIDDPLDPANKYLSHASVESSEMVNIYSGNAITDEQGVATVQLPSWFEAVNGDLRYQLTVVGRRAQAWISQEVKDGKFQISSDAANAKVSWQITGVRQDAYAKANPLVVEQEKDAVERGFYKHPELYGQPAQKQTGWAVHPETMRAIQLAKQKQVSNTANK